jgi:hypothetical protein
MRHHVLPLTKIGECPSLRRGVSFGEGTKLLRSIRKELSVSLLAMSALVLSASAYAAELYTSPEWADRGQSYHSCTVANVSIYGVVTGVNLTVQMLSSSGVVIANSSNNFFLDAGQTYELSDTQYTGLAFCHVSLPQIQNAGSTIRANMSVFHYTGAYYETLALSEAR